jgi:hypothetical protein
MEQESIVYGCIKDAAYDREEYQHRGANRRALLSLPAANEWPLISREMFSIPGNNSGSSQYQTEVMHFGASYKAIEYEWEQWIADFESLLRNMYWVSATVHLETELSGTHTFTWNSLTDSHQPGSQEMQIHCEWSQETALGF